ncbi:MAG: site-2 protease family protein [Gammaproteobacteria bacterium]|nr:site-2 protease family protein [Gammaproteobacteria bacterium]
MNLTTIQLVSVWILPVLFAITIHEVAHARVAYYFGDESVKLAGRLSLNPFKHIELLGTILIPLIMVLVVGFAIGWAKPVMIDIRKLRNPDKNIPWIALAGPMSNFVMAIMWALVLRLIFEMDVRPEWVLFLVYMSIAGVLINSILMVFNLLPIPPLDGSKVIMPFLPKNFARIYASFSPYGFYLIIALMLLGLLGIILNPLINNILTLLINLSGFPSSVFAGFIQSLN